MSTRGLYGFRKNGVDKLTYNHADSYPDGLGYDMLELCRDFSIKDLNKLYDLLEMVNEDSTPTKEQIKICKENHYTDFGVSSQSETDWYCLLRRLQGNFEALKMAVEENKHMFMIDSQDFIKDSLFCEYGYIVNLDSESLEFWLGFQREPDKTNRYGTELDDGYYPCKFVLNISLNSIDTDSIAKWVKKMNKLAGEDDD